MSTPRIDSYSFGRVVIDGQAHVRDVIILPDHVLRGWWRQEGHVLQPDDLKPVFNVAPETLIVGQGASSRMQVAAKTRQALQAAGIELVAHSSAEACRLYNTLREKRAVVAALHLTC